MTERYFLVIRCLKYNGDRVVPLSSPPDVQLSPLGTVQVDDPCLCHNSAVNPVSYEVNNSHHQSLSVLIGLSDKGSRDEIMEIASREAESVFKMQARKRKHKRLTF